MEPAPLTADEIIGPTAPPQAVLDVGDHGTDAPHAAGEDIEPPYLRLRTLVDETLVKGRESPYPPDLDLTEFATLAENTGVEAVRRDTPPPPLPRTLIADVASFPHAMPTAVEPATEVVVERKSRFSLSRGRLIGWGTLAFCAGVLASAGVRMLVAPTHLGPSANAATAAASAASAATTASAPAPAPVPAAVPAAAPAAPVAAVAVAAPAVEAPAANTAAPDTARTEAPHLAMAASPPSVRTRSGATAQARGQTRARGKLRSRNGSAAAAAAEVAGETDAPSSDEPAAAPAPAPAARSAHPAPSWVDPFAQ